MAWAGPSGPADHIGCMETIRVDGPHTRPRQSCRGCLENGVHKTVGALPNGEVRPYWTHRLPDNRRFHYCETCTFQRGFAPATTSNAEEVAAIRRLDHRSAAEVYRFAPPGHRWFADPDLHREFTAHFASLGGMTTEVSKAIGWEPQPHHRHMTRDIKPAGVCPACDRHHFEGHDDARSP